MRISIAGMRLRYLMVLQSSPVCAFKDTQEGLKAAPN